MKKYSQSQRVHGTDLPFKLRPHFRMNERLHFSEPNDDQAHGLYLFLTGLYSPCGVRGWPTDGPLNRD